MSLSLPPGFLWGAATAAAQIEGASHEDGKLDSIWDHFARTPGNIANGDNLDPAVDHYHRMPEDVALMRELGLDSYRFSVSWARVKPADGAPNPLGLDFYSRLVDELLENGILPWLTLYHWDLPQAVQETGGWANRDTAKRFLDYAVVVHEALGDRVTHWTTFNEPFCSAYLGYASGEHAPGLQQPRSALAALHHQHLAHGLAVKELRTRGAGRLGITLNLTNAIPNDPADAADVDAARRIDALWNRAFLDPMFRGSYPEDLMRDVAALDFASLIHDGDLDTIAQPLDFLGVNYYHDDTVSAHPLPVGTPSGLRPTDKQGSSPFVESEFVTFPPRGLPVTAMGWEINAPGLRTLLERLGEEYPDLPPMYVTENGSAWDDVVSDDGRVHDADRVAYLEAHVQAVADAIADGADVRGYFAWSLLDNFEWAWGYEKRFGVVRVDYDTQVRTIKDSGHALARMIEGSRSAAL
jgi:beta-glucosidase